MRVSTSTETKSTLIFSKTVLAPIQNGSIPRLELMGVLIGVRALKFVEKQLNIPIKSKILFTDSQCVLHWLKSTKVLSVFVENRVKEIKESNNLLFRYIPTDQNPADIGSRGCSCLELKQSFWWEGPDWLKLPENNWPNFKDFEPNPENISKIDSENRSKESIVQTNLVSVANERDGSGPLTIDIKRYSTSNKLVRMTAWIMRFVNNLKGFHEKSNILNVREIQEAKHIWEKYIQEKMYKDCYDAISSNKKNDIVHDLGLKIDPRGILRCHGRLENAELIEDAIFPKLLPKNHLFTKLLVEHIHKKTFHSGVSQTLATIRNEYWIPQGRRTVQNIIRLCNICQRFQGGPYKTPPFPPLPMERVNPSPSFQYTGLDYFGPLYIKEAKKTVKVWVCLFTCLVIRAVHLELVRDMTAENFLLAIRRFIARRGRPLQIISDNAPTFLVSKTVLKTVYADLKNRKYVISYLGNEGVAWKFIVPLAPWMGGFYERLVGVVKFSLRKALGKLLFNCDQLNTLLLEIEAVVNTRPLIYVSSDLNSDSTLTPNHFLSLNPNVGIPVNIANHLAGPNSTSRNLIELWKKGQKHLDSFWKVWKSQYLLCLRERFRRDLKAPKIRAKEIPQIGNIVVVQDSIARGMWKLAKIMELPQGKDGQVRSAKILLQDKSIVYRPLNRLYPLETG